jgi:hypothetical protein
MNMSLPQVSAVPFRFRRIQTRGRRCLAADLQRPIPGQSKPQGIFYSAEFSKLFVANRDDGTYKIFRSNDFKLIGNLPVGTDADHDQSARGSRRY